MTKDLVVSVVATVHNEQEHITEFIAQTTRVLRANYRNYELVLVDDGSTDGSVAAAHDMLARAQNIRLLVLSKRFGKEIALTAGLDPAIGDYVVLMSASLEDPPEIIPQLVARARQGFDIVYAIRSNDSGEPVLYRIATSVFYWLNSRFTGLDMRREATDFRCLSRRVVNSINQLKEHNRFMRMLFAYVGYKVDGIEYRASPNRAQRRDARYAGKFKLALDSIISFSNKPLRYVSALSLVISLLALVGAFAVFLERLIYKNVVEGWTSLMLVQLLMFCILFFFLSIISEYISRILTESQNRPLYYIREEHGGTSFNVEEIVDVD